MIGDGKDALRTSSRSSVTMRHIRITLVALLTMMMGEELASQSRWHWQNPLPQGNSLEAVQFLDANVVFACGWAGTVLRSTDGGLTWTHKGLSTDLPTLKDLYFLDGNNGFVLGTSLHRTSDGGESWLRLNLPTGITERITFFDPSIGIAVGSSGVFRTADGAGSWSERTNNTKKWLKDVHRIGSQGAIVVGDSGTILFSSDQGQSWSVRASGTLRHLRSISILDDANGIIGGDQGTILRTTDGGMTWTAIQVNEVFQFDDVAYVNASTLVGITPFAVWVSTNTGSSWTKYQPSGMFGNNRLSFLGTTGLLVGTGGRVYRTTNAGVTWSDRRTIVAENELTSVSFPDRTTGFIAGTSGTLLRTGNGGASWQKLTSGVTTSLLGLFFTDANTGIVVGRGGVIRKTTNSGATWTSQTSGTTRDLWWVHCFDVNIAVVVGANGTVLRTTNAGSSWTSQGSGTTQELHCVVSPSPSIVLAVGNSGTIIRSGDGGITWSTVPSGTTSTLWTVAFSGPVLGVAVGMQGTVLRTTDAGASWSKVSFPAQPTILNLYGVSFESPSRWVAVGGNFGVPGLIMESVDGGLSWTETRNIADSPLGQVLMIDGSTGFIIGTNGIILGTTPGGNVTSLDVASASIPERFSLHQNFPNPFNPATTISYSLAATSFVTMSIFNVMGQRISTLVAGELPAGLHSVRWEPQSLPAGVYFCRLQAGESIFSRKMLYLK